MAEPSVLVEKFSFVQLNKSVLTPATRGAMKIFHQWVLQNGSMGKPIDNHHNHDSIANG